MRSCLVLACVLGVAGAAHAQTCWPGQTLDGEHHACVGAPQCPERLVEHGENCIARVVRDDEAPVATTEPTTVTIAWPEVHPGGELHHATMVRGDDEGLMAFALALFDSGWAVGWVAGALDEATLSCDLQGSAGFGGRVGCGSWPLAAIPLVGGLLSSETVVASAPPGFTLFRGRAVIGSTLGIPSLLLEVAGVIALIVADVNQTDELALPALEAEGVRVSLVPGATGADAGASVVASF